MGKPNPNILVDVKIADAHFEADRRWKRALAC
jgi:hypothetical protein